MRLCAGLGLFFLFMMMVNVFLLHSPMDNVVSCHSLLCLVCLLNFVFTEHAMIMKIDSIVCNFVPPDP